MVDCCHGVNKNKVHFIKLILIISTTTRIPAYFPTADKTNIFVHHSTRYCIRKVTSKQAFRLKNTSRMSTWSRRDFEFSESQADREFNCPLYKSTFEETRAANGTRWQRNVHEKKSRSKLTVSEVPSVRLFNGVEKFKENISKQQEHQRSRKPKKCAKGCRRDELTQEGLLDMIKTGSSEPLNSVVFTINPPGFNTPDLGKQRKIGLYIRSFE